ncbi:MAG: hypothetical protein RLZZ21_999 [Planctomycetota bacterium]|jgi:hypothetical protein
MRTMLFAALVAAAVVPEPVFAAKQTGFDPRIVTFGDAREEIKNTPITQRPNRPLHVYGNSVRRRQARGNSTR